MKSIITFFIKYSVAVNIVVLAFIIFGFIGMRSMKSSFFPLVESKIITIQATYPGASPQEIEEGVVLKIEENLKGLLGIDRVTSVSNENAGLITVEILNGYDIDVVLADVKNAVDRVPSYPTGMEPLVVGKLENIRQTISFVVSGENVPLKSLKEISQRVEKDIRKMDGITQIDITGYPLEEIEIAVRELDLLAYDLTIDDVAAAVSNENLLTTGGNIKTDTEEYLIRAKNRAYHADDLDNIVVKTNIDGSVVLLRDVASVNDIFQETPNASYFNGNLAVNINISNTNIEDLISSADKIKEYIEDFNQRYSNIQLSVVSDSSVTLTQRTQLLTENAIIGILLVLFFLSLFLNTKLAFWVAFGLPISFLGMFIFAAHIGVTINVLSLFGMIIVIGILVDDGIVIAENIYHHFEKGKSPVQAAIDGTMEVLPPIISAILTTVLAFSTFLFLDGRIGDVFGEVSVIVILTLAVSLIEALIILPAHVAHSTALVREENRKPNHSVFGKIFTSLRSINKYGDKIMVFLRDRFYAPFLKFALNNKFLTFSIFLGLFIITIGSIQGGIVRTTFFPNIASDRIQISLKMPEGTYEGITDSLSQIIEAAAWEVNEVYTEKQEGNLQVVENIVKRIGPGSAVSTITINLLPGELRNFPSYEITNAIRDKVGPIEGVESLVFGSGSNFGGSPVAVSLLGNNIPDLKAAKTELKSALSNITLLKDVTDNDPAGIKEIQIDLKENAHLLGLTTKSVMSQVRNSFFGFQVQRFQRGEDEIKVWVRYDRESRSTIQQLDQMKINTPSGDLVALGEIADYDIIRGEVAINHLDGQREIQVTADLKDPSASATDIIEEIRTSIFPAIQAKYPTVTALYEGQNREANKFTISAKVVFPIVIALIYIVIAFAFRSYSQPLLLLLLVPFSMTAVSLGHWIHGFPLNILSLLGIIALIGIMVNDGLVLISKFNGNLKAGMEFDEALYEAGKSRFRAIFLTSLTTIAGLAPLIFETSRQAQFLIPMAISIAYGIGFATVLTLIVLPIYLAFINRIKLFFKWLWTGENVDPVSVERAIKELQYENEDIH
ncbi:efflux RND transporter permease subunit [Membranihabitans marinus]|uniref:efflux RND transporter permease subunit n=1 Tax=Membranihabitans marinus TaxID=1227546 RepID=UPI001F014099|nr:efflux RND transporter permease subunit [Membranihabitans marinus]